jgi:hypothetical protein
MSNFFETYHLQQFGKTLHPPSEPMSDQPQIKSNRIIGIGPPIKATTHLSQIQPNTPLRQGKSAGNNITELPKDNPHNHRTQTPVTREHNTNPGTPPGRHNNRNPHIHSKHNAQFKLSGNPVCGTRIRHQSEPTRIQKYEQQLQNDGKPSYGDNGGVSRK